MNYDRKALKDHAKELIRHSNPRSWKANCVYLLVTRLLPTLIIMVALTPVVGALMNFMERLLRDPSLQDQLHQFHMYRYYGGYVGNYALERELISLSTALLSALGILFLLGILLALFQTVMGYGHCAWSLRLWREEHPGAGDMFSGFGHLGRALGAGIMVYIFTVLWSMLFVIPGSLLLALVEGTMGDSAPGLIVLAEQLVSIAMSLGVALVSCRYALTRYFLLSDPHMGVFEAIRASRDTMEGNIGKLFFLRLSFLGWALLVMLIVWVVTAVLLIAVTYGVVFALLASHPELMESYVSDETALMAGLVALRGIFGGMAVSVVVSWLVSLPLLQWLSAYRGAAEAGFFATLTAPVFTPDEGEEEPTPDRPGPAVPPVPPIPPAPPAPPADPFGADVPPAPQFPPQGPTEE